MGIKKNCKVIPPKEVVSKITVEDMTKRCEPLSGFIIIIEGAAERGTEGKFELHYRENNPCQGGHLRKYNDQHDDCTRPQDSRPGDLPNAFPNGRPIGLVYRLKFPKEAKVYHEALFSDKSPWIAGFGGEKNVILLKSNSEHTAYIGIYLKSGQFDPTVFVNLLKAMNISKPETFNKCIGVGMSVQEALTFSAFFSSAKVYDPVKRIYNQGESYVPSQSAYYFDPMNSAKRMIEQRYVNLTGGIYNKQGVLLSTGTGYWGDRFDYNRPDMACVFRTSKGNEEDKKEPEFNIGKRYAEVKKEKGLKTTEFLTFDDCLMIFKEAVSV